MELKSFNEVFVKDKKRKEKSLYLRNNPRYRIRNQEQFKDSIRGLGNFSLDLRDLGDDEGDITWGPEGCYEIVLGEDHCQSYFVTSEGVLIGQLEHPESGFADEMESCYDAIVDTVAGDPSLLADIPLGFVLEYDKWNACNDNTTFEQRVLLGHHRLYRETMLNTPSLDYSACTEEYAKNVVQIKEEFKKMHQAIADLNKADANLHEEEA